MSFFVLFFSLFVCLSFFVFLCSVFRCLKGLKAQKSQAHDGALVRSQRDIRLKLQMKTDEKLYRFWDGVAKKAAILADKIILGDKIKAVRH